MVNQQLVGWIKAEEVQGYSSEQLYNSLIQQGYAPTEVTEAINFDSQQPPESTQQYAKQPSQPIKKPKNHLPIIVISIIFIGLLLAGGGAYWYISSQGISLDSDIIASYFGKTEESMSESAQKTNDANIDLEADTETPSEELPTSEEPLLDTTSSETSALDTSSSEEPLLNDTPIDSLSLNDTPSESTSLNETSDCDTMDCFEANFAECKPSTVTSELEPSITYSYEILGLKEELCEVKSKAINIPNPSWIGKEMICLFDNSLDFETAAGDISTCEGELYDLLSAGATATVNETSSSEPLPLDDPSLITPPLGDDLMEIPPLDGAPPGMS